MRFVYFTKLLKGKTLPETAAFLKNAGLDGADMAVRPGYPVTPDNCRSELPKAVKLLKDEGLAAPLISAPTDLIDPSSPAAVRMFEACAEAGVGAVKIGYFHYSGGPFELAISAAKKKLDGFAALSAKTGVRTLYHTHSGSNLGSNCEAMRLLLDGLDPHHVGAFVDTGHQMVGGAPLRLGLSMVAPWFSVLAIKDALWRKTESGWKWVVVPAGEGIVNWGDVKKSLADRKFTGVVSLHGEYESENSTDRLNKAKAESAFLRKLFQT